MCEDRNTQIINSQDYINHFGVRIKKNERNKLTRENYCEPTNIISPSFKKMYKKLFEDFKRLNEEQKLKYAKFFSSVSKIPNDKLLDLEHYTDSYVANHFNDCMENFDLNMDYFSNLNKKEFNHKLNFLIKKYRFREITDLNKLSQKSGVYILVLDEYKEIYIGVSQNIKNRIMNHWRNKKTFETLIWGSVENSIISIDSFGALDTTRIFYLPTNNPDIVEEKCVKSFDNKFLLNRVGGGLNAEKDSLMRFLKTMITKKTHKLTK